MANSGSIAKRWCFTLNNPTSKEKDAVKAAMTLERVLFAVIGLEQGEKENTPHLQGFVHWKKKQRMTALKKLMPRGHFEIARGSDQASDEYCTKENVWLRVGESQELKKACVPKTYLQAVELANRLARGENKRELLDDPKLAKACYAYRNVVNDHAAIIREDDQRRAVAQEVGDPYLLPWQVTLLTKLKGDPHPRDIHWVVDTRGGSGKTFLAEWLDSVMGAALYQNCKTTDVAHAYNGERIAVFDLERSTEDRINYGAIERVKGP